MYIYTHTNETEKKTLNTSIHVNKFRIVRVLLNKLYMDPSQQEIPISKSLYIL